MKKKIIFGLVLCAFLSVMGTYTVKDVKAAGGYETEEIKNYITLKEAPTEADKIFAGWYNGETPVKSIEDVTDATVPKFVDDDVLTIISQLKKDPNNENNIHVRFLTSVDSLNYRSVQFDVGLENSDKVVTTTVSKVYSSVTAEGETFKPKEVFSEDSHRIAMVLLTDFSKDSTDSDEYGYWGDTIIVTPKWTTMDGTIVTGKTRQLEVNDGLYDTEVNSGSTRTWHSLADGIAKVNQSTEDVSIDLLQDVSITSNLTLENTNGKNIVLDGNGNKATVSAPILIYQAKGLVEVNDLDVKHTKNILFRIGKNGTTYSEKLTVNFNNLDIESESTQKDNGLIQAGYVTMNLDMNMTGVKIKWTSSETINTGAITSGNISTPTLNLTMNDCELNVSEAPGARVIYAKTGVTGAIALDNTTVKTQGVNVIEDGDMTLSLDKDSTFYHGETQSVALVDGVQYSELTDAVTAMNGKTSDTTMNLVQDVTHASQIEINVEGNQNGTITINGSGHTLTGDFDGATDAHFIFFKKHLGTVNLNNITIEHKNTGKNLMTFGEQEAADTDTTVIVNLKDVTMNSESSNAYSIINAVQLTNFDITLDNVALNWKTGETADTSRAAIRYGNSGSSRTVSLDIIDSTLNMSGALDSGIVYAKTGFNENSTISIQNSVITPYAGQKAYKEYANDFAPAVYMNKNGYATLADAVNAANQSEEDVTLTLWNDVTISSNLTLQNENGKDIVWDGNGRTATVSAPILIYQEQGVVEIKDLVVNHTKNILFRIGNKDTTYSEKLTVNLENLDITSESNQSKGLIQAGFASMQLDLNMANVDLVWTPTSTHAKGAITAGNADTGATPALNLTMTGCKIDASAASDGYGVYVESAVTGNLVLNDTTITSNKDSVYDQKMKFTRNTATVLSTYPKTQVQVGDVVYNELSEAIADVNTAEKDVTITLLTDINISSNLTLKNVNGKNIVLDGKEHTATVSAPILIYQEQGLVEIKDLVVTHTSNILFRIGDKNTTYSEKLTVNLENLDITSTSNQSKGLIQAGFAAMELDVNMTDVNLVWQPTSTHAKGAITAGNADLTATTTLNLTMTGCTIDASQASNGYGVYVESAVTGNLVLNDTTITSNQDSVYDQNMKFTRNTTTVLSTYPTTQVQMGDVVYNELSEAVADANESQEYATISFLSDTVTFDENVDIANVNGKTITIDGCNKALQPDNAAIRIYQKSGVVEVKNMVVPNHEKSVLLRIGDRSATYSDADKLTVNLENLNVTSTSNQSKGLIQAGYGAMQLDLNMTNVDLVWKPTDTHAKGAITIGCDQLTATMLLNLTMTNCTLDVSEATNGCAIYVEDNATGEIHLIGTNITTAVGESVYNNNIPVYDVNKAATVLFEGSQFCEIIIEDVAALEFATYTETLEERGFTEHSTKNIDNAEYAVYKNDEMVLYVNQFNSAMRIVYSDIDTAFLPETEQPTFEKVCDTKGYMVGVTAGDYENGMCFIYLLADGTFLVYDGGRNEADADHLYELLQRIATENDINEVVISNWMLTHAHGDHSGCLKEFFAKYADSVEIQKVLFNTSHSSLIVDVDRTEEKRVLNAIQNYSPNTKIVKLHSGQEFWLADMKVEVLYTIEDLTPGTSDDYNNTSTITRLTIDGKTILMNGDAATDVWELMCNIYGDALKSDYLQVPHHGTAPGGTTSAYDKIQPTYLLWPCGDNLYEDNLNILKNWYTNNHLLNMVDSENSYIAGVYDATNNTERITEFPFSE